MTKIFLDLEETVINNWWDGILTNHIEPIKELLSYLDRQGKIASVGIFSFAISGADDMHQFFERGMAKQLSDVLEIDPFTMKNVITCEQMLNASKQYCGLHYESWSDFCTIKNKHGAFKEWAMLHADKTKAVDNWVLIDDVVPLETLIHKHTDTSNRGAAPCIKISTIPVHLINNGFCVDRQLIFG